MRTHSLSVLAALAALSGLTACGGDGNARGSVRILVAAEDTITEGLRPGSDDESIVDGWSVDFDRYIVAIGDVRIESSGSAASVRREGALVVDLASVPEGGLSLGGAEDVPARLYDQVFYRTSIAVGDSERDPSVSEADFTRMVSERCTYLLVGQITRADGERCIRGDGTMCTPAPSIGFDLCVPAPTTFGPCASDTGIAGVTVTEGTQTPVVFTIHGDHVFFNGFPAGAEGSVARRAQWLANADVDANGTVTRADLEAIGASDLGSLFPSDPGDGMPGFTLGGAPLPLESAWDYVVGQLATQGHFQGEGECPYALAAD